MAETLSRDKKFEEVLDEKRAQGYRIESHSDTEAVVWMKGRRRFFNLFGGNEEPFLLSFDQEGHASSRRIDVTAD